MAENVKRTITIVGASQGLDKLAADVDKVTAAQTRAAASERSVATIRDDSSRATAGLSSKAEAYIRQNDALAKAMATVERGEAILRATRNAGLPTVDAISRALDAARAKYDSLTQAIEQNMAAERRAISIRREAEQASAVQRASSYQQGINQRLGVTNDFQSAARGADIAAYGSELDRLKAKYNPLFAAGQQYRASLTEINLAARAGAVSEAERAAAIMNTKVRFTEQVNAIRGVTDAEKFFKTASNDAKKANDEHSGSMMSLRTQTLMLHSAISNTASSLGSGASAVQVFMQQAPDLVQAFSEGPGGVSGTLKAMGMRVAGLATGWVGLGVGIAAGLGAAGAAVIRFQSQQDRLALSLNGVGRAAGVDLAGLTSIANAGGARNPALGQGGATDLTAQFVSTGRVSSSLLPRALDLTTPFAHSTGQDVTKAGAELAHALADPVKGAAELSEKLGALSGNERELIRSLAESGDILGAQRELLRQVAESTKDASDRTWDLTKAWDKLKSQAGGVMDKLGGGLSGALYPSLEQQRGLYQTDLNRQNAFGGVFRNDQATTVDRLMIEGLTRQMQREADQARQKAVDEAASRESADIGGIINAIDPLGARARKMDDDIARLKKDLADPNVTSRVPGGADALSRSLSMVQVERDDLNPFKRILADGLLAVQAAQARTLAEREAVEAQRAYNETLRSTHDLALAAAAADAKRNEMLVEANRQIADFNKEGARGLRYSKLSSYDAGRQRIIDEYHDFMERNGGGATNAPRASAPEVTKSKASPYGNLWDSWAAFNKAPVDWSKPADRLSTEPHPAIAAARARVASSAQGGGQGLSDRLAAYDLDTINRPFKQANQALDAQDAITKIQGSGASGAALEGMIARQKMLNDLRSQGVRITADVNASLDAYATHATATARAEEALAKSIQDADAIRSGARDSLHTFVNDLISGKNAASAFRDTMEQLGKKLLDSSLDRIVDLMLGKQGTPSLGMLGGGASGGSAGGGLLALLPKLFGFADGGIMTAGGPLPLRRYADGGVANSPQLAMFGEGSGPEAYVPLKNGGIPVHVRGGSGHTFQIGGPVLQVQGSIDAATMPKVQAMMAETLQQFNGHLQRNLPQMVAKSQSRWVA